MRPAAVTPLIRRLAAAGHQEKEAPLIGCWVHQGWSSSVRFTGHPEWPDTAAAEAGESGLVIVVVARERGSSVRVCEFLVDTWCLGVKTPLGAASGALYDADRLDKGDEAIEQFGALMPTGGNALL